MSFINVNGSKKQMYALLSLALVLVVGGGAYVFLGSSGDNSYENGPPVLEENTALTGTIAVSGERWFNVENVKKTGEDLKSHPIKTPSNFLIFTAPKDVQVFGTVTRIMEDLLVDDGNSGYVFGTFDSVDNKWHLYPEKNYLGAVRLDEAKTLSSCKTYFVIKIDDNPKDGARSGWTGEQRLKIAYDEGFMQKLSQGSADCSLADRSIVQNRWNLISTSGPKTASLSADLSSAFDSVKSVWDTTVINQTGGLANTKIFTLPSDDASLLGRYLSDNTYLKKAGLFALEGTKRDMWVYVGNEAKPVEVVSTLTPVPQTVNLTPRIESLINSWRENPDNFREKIVEFQSTVLPVPEQEVFTFENVLSMSDFDLSQFTPGTFRNIDLGSRSVLVQTTGKKFADLVLVGNDARGEYSLPIPLALKGNLKESEIKYIWENNRCKETEDKLFDFYVQEFKFAMYRLVNNNPSYNLDQLKALLLESSDLDDRVKEVIRSLNEKEMLEYRDSPPSLSADCAGDFAACARAMVCSTVGLSDMMKNTIKIDIAPMTETESADSDFVEMGQTVNVASPNNQTGVLVNMPESCSDPIKSVSMFGSRSFSTVESSIDAIIRKDSNLSIEELSFMLDISECAGFLQIENVLNDQFVLAKLEEGLVYKLQSERIYIEDTYSPDINTKGVVNVFVTLSESGRLYVFLKPVPNLDTQIFDGYTIHVTDGLFWDLSGEKDLNGITSVINN